MALNPGTRLLCFSLLLFRDHTLTKVVDPHSLCYNFTILLKSPPGQPWCEVQGQVDGRTFLHCDCGTNRVISLSPLGMKIKATKEWEEQTQTLKDLGDELKQLLPGINLHKDTPRAPLPLQAKMCCQQEAGRRTRADWQFGFGGQTFLLYDSENMKWTEVHLGGRQMREEWEKDRDVTKFFWRTSVGDCNHWLRTFLGHWEKMLETAEQPPMTPGSAQSKVTAITRSPWILLVPIQLFCSMLPFIFLL